MTLLRFESLSAYDSNTVDFQVEVGSALVKGVTRGALGIGIVIDGVTVFLSSRDLARGSSTKFSEALNKLADLKEKELDDIMNVIDESNVFASADTVERF